MCDLVVSNLTEDLCGETDPLKFSYQPIYEFAAPDRSILQGEAGSYDTTNYVMVGSEPKIPVDFDKPDIVYVSRWNRHIFAAFMILLGLGSVVFLAFYAAIAFEA